ncbi:ribonuclease P protein component [Aggregatilinea sp.]|jgi:ribonuclease P protein component|uniref:ribonuclease P protein component n=1 Tax=Aggregatilinea sp. TaxID=2806333 RepID=UPI003FA59A1A
MQRPLRLRRQEDFAHLRKTGRTYRHPFLTLSVAPNLLSHNRYGFVTSKRLGNAVVRNTVRRVLREVIRQSDPLLANGFDVVVVARPHIVGQPYQAVERATVTCLKQAGLWEPPVGEQQP